MTYRHSLSDLTFNHYTGHYCFKNIKISNKAYELFKLMIENERERCMIEYIDQTGKKHRESLHMDEIAMLDGMFAWSHDVILPQIPGKIKTKSPCSNPAWHNFERYCWTTYYIRECTICGYSPELDAGKEYYQPCHAEFKAWEAK